MPLVQQLLAAAFDNPLEEFFAKCYSSNIQIDRDPASGSLSNTSAAEKKKNYRSQLGTRLHFVKKKIHNYTLPYLMAEKHQHREPIGSNHGQNLFVNRFLQADGKFGNIFHP